MADREYYVDQWLRRDASDVDMEITAFEEMILKTFRSGDPHAEQFQSASALRTWIATPQGANAYAGVMNRTAAIARAARRMHCDVDAVPPSRDLDLPQRIPWESVVVIAERLYRSAPAAH